jgi:hypothetical protein
MLYTTPIDVLPVSHEAINPKEWKAAIESCGSSFLF